MCAPQRADARASWQAVVDGGQEEEEEDATQCFYCASVLTMVQAACAGRLKPCGGFFSGI